VIKLYSFISPTIKVSTSLLYRFDDSDSQVVDLICERFRRDAMIRTGRFRSFQTTRIPMNRDMVEIKVDHD